MRRSGNSWIRKEKAMAKRLCVRYRLHISAVGLCKQLCFSFAATPRARCISPTTAEKLEAAILSRKALPQAVAKRRQYSARVIPQPRKNPWYGRFVQPILKGRTTAIRRARRTWFAASLSATGLRRDRSAGCPSRIDPNTPFRRRVGSLAIAD